MTIPDIARRMTLATQTVQRFADAALEEGFIELTENPDHKRARLVQLTPKGVDILLLLEQRESDWARSIAGNIKADDILEAAATLARVRERIIDKQSS